MGKIIYQYPRLNRFVQNRTLYEHDEVSIAFVAKAEFSDKSEEFMTCLPIEENDTILDVSKKLKAKIDKIRDKKSTVNTDGANNVVDKIGHIWRPIRSSLVGIPVIFPDEMNLSPVYSVPFLYCLLNIQILLELVLLF